VHGFSATAAGAAMLPSVILLFLLSRRAGALSDRTGPGWLLIAGPAIAAIGFGLFTLAGTTAGYWSGFFPAFVVLGLGMSITVAPLTNTVMSSVSRAHAGVASGINNAVSEAAGLLAVAVFGLAMTLVFQSSLERGMEEKHVGAALKEHIHAQEQKLAAIELPDDARGVAAGEAIHAAFIAGFRTVMGIAAALALLSALCAALTLPRRVPAHPSRPPPPRDGTP